jgi:beta-lactamase regulating signal transducer with metallopeptidase domain
MMSFVPELLVKLTLILTFGLVVAASARSFSPSLRHLILLATIGGVLALPLAMWVSPQWNVALIPRGSSTLFLASSDPGMTADEQTTAAKLSAAFRAPSGEASVLPASGSRAFDADAVHPSSRAREILQSLAVLPFVWAVGFLAIIGWLAIGRFRLRRIARASWPLDSADWSGILEDERTYGSVDKRVLLYSSSVVSTPLTWGSLAPVILLPEDAIDWPEAHRRIVLRHELAHISRGDSLSQLIAGFTCALYWFHPLVWITERRLRAECERACDDNVVSLGTPAAEYAAHLLEVARSARAFGAPGFLSVAMARPSQLEGRLLAVLNESRRRVSLSRGVRPVAVLLTALVLIPLAAFRAVPKPDDPTANQTGSSTPKRILEQVSSEQVSSATSPSIEQVSSASSLSVGKDEPADTTFQLSVPGVSAGTLILDLRSGGSVAITGWDRSEVSVRALLGGRDWRATRVTLTPEGNDARLVSDFIVSSNTQSTSHAFRINVPRKYNVRLSSSGGSLSIDGVEGRFTGHTGGGEITMARSNGEAQIQTGGGDIYIHDSRLNGSVSTGGGVVRIERNAGDLDGASGSGPVIYSKSGTTVHREKGVNVVGVAGGEEGYTIHAGSGSGSGVGVSASAGSGSGSITTYTNDGKGGTSYFASSGIRMSSAGGAISLLAAPDGARVTTGGGSIRIGRSGGEVYAETGGGPIDIGPASGSVQAHTGAGDVRIELVGSAAHSVDVTSGKGQVVLVVPRDLNAMLDLETAYTNNLGHKTRILSQVPLQTTETAYWDDTQGTPRRYVRARQTVGAGGGVIRVRTVNGDVILNRGP